MLTDRQKDKKQTNEQTELHQFRKEPSYDGDLHALNNFFSSSINKVSSKRNSMSLSVVLLEKLLTWNRRAIAIMSTYKSADIKKNFTKPILTVRGQGEGISLFLFFFESQAIRHDLLQTRKHCKTVIAITKDISCNNLNT